MIKSERGEKKCYRFSENNCSYSFFIQRFFTFIGGLSFEKFDVYKNIAYGEAERNIMDIYVPESAYDNEHNGVILYIHGVRGQAEIKRI